MVSCSGAEASSASRATSALLGFFVLREDAAGAVDDGGGQASEARNLDAVALTGGAGLDGVQECDAAGRLLDGDAQVAEAGKLFGQQGELVIVGGEERARADAAVDVLQRGPRERQAIEGSGAAAHLVEQDE